MPNVMILQIFQGVDMFLNAVSAALIVYALMSWIMRPDNAVYVFLARFADFVLTPFRPAARWLINKGLRIDVSVILALMCISVLRTILSNAAYRLIY